MKAEHYRKAITEAVKNNDPAMLESIVNRLADCAEALQIMRSKGYGTAGMGIATLARMVPPKPKCDPVIFDIWSSR